MRCIALASFAVAALLMAVANAAPLNDLSIFKYNPVANAAAVVTSGNARFTVLTDGVIRMEYSASGTFEDRATLAFVNRNLPVPSFTQSTNNGELTIKTNTITLTYRTGNPFSISSLWVSTIGGAVWNYGDYDNGNLFGTIKSLDELCNPTLNCTQNANWRVHSESLHCAFGVATTGGWTTVDDTKNYIMSSVDGQWFNDGLRSSSDVDTYFFGHGKNFKQAIFDYVQLSGKAPLPTKNLLGSWYTRWFDFDNDDLVRLLDTYSRNDLPLDVLILDMNWHMKNDWTGYSFDRTLYPVPEDTIDMVHSRGLVIGANLHDADGFGYWEDEYATMARISGINPASMMAVPFAPLNATYMHTMEDQVLKKLGFDIWWIDWQQGGNYGGCDGYQMNPTILTNHVRSTDAIRRGDNVRANILARWGGLGTHRYPVGFSGDVSQLSWTCFEYQPYFVATAANVAYGYISNDLVGPSGDHELHVRWMQFGAFSPIMRIHDRGMSSGSCMADDSCAIVNIWDLEYDHVEAIRMAMKQRNSLLPYTYTMSRNTFDNGLAMVHPMYYDFPNEANAYDITANSGAQYMFGDDMFVAPITKQSQQAYHMIAKNVWIPPGTWYDDVFGALVTGPTTMTLQYTLYDVPLFIRAGAVIPRIPNPSTMGVAGTTFAAVDWYVYPGATQGSGRMYEDDGVSYDYVRGVYGWTTATYSTSGLTTTVTIGATNGTFTGQPATRNYRIVLVGVLPLSQATVNSAAAPYVRFPTLGQLSWTYDGATGSVIIDCGSQSTSQQVSVSVTYGAQDASQSLTTKLKVFARRSMLGKRVVDNWQQTPFSQNAGPGFTKQLAARAGYISAVAGTNVSLAMTLMSSYPLLVNDAIQELGGYPGPTQAPQYNDRILLQLFDFTRQDMLLCGSWECVQTNTNYQVMWADGFQPNPSDNCAVGFYDYFSYSDVDNWATTQSTPPSGYAAATFGNGNVLSCGGADRRCIDVYWNPTTTDHLTTSNPMGAQWAADHGYSKVNSCIGYAYVNDTAAPQSMDELRAYVAKIRARGTPFDSAIRGTQRPHEEKKKHHHHGKQLKAADPQPPGDNSAVQIALALLQSMGAY